MVMPLPAFILLGVRVGLKGLTSVIFLSVLCFGAYIAIPLYAALLLALVQDI